MNMGYVHMIYQATMPPCFRHSEIALARTYVQKLSQSELVDECRIVGDVKETEAANEPRVDLHSPQLNRVQAGGKGNG
jgi:hypothetical protein